MVDKLIMSSAMKGKFFFGSVIIGNTLYWQTVGKRSVYNDVYGLDGNGGKDLRIITDLSDEEIARLKHVRRLAWHWKGSRTMF